MGVVNREINVSLASIMRVALVAIGILVFYYVFDILLLLFLAFVIASAVNIAADWMYGYKFPRMLAIVSIYVLSIGALGVTVYLLIPAVVEQFNSVSQSFPETLNQLQQYIKTLGRTEYTQPVINSLNDTENVKNYLPGIGSGLFSTTVSFFNFLGYALIVLIIAFYISLDSKGFDNVLTSLIPAKRKQNSYDFIQKAKFRVGSWLLGQLILGLILFVLTYISLSIVGVKYALLLSLLAGLLEVIPLFGPIIAAVPALIFSFAQAPSIGLIVLIIYFVLQMLENNLFGPLITGKATGLHPVIVIIVLLIGARFAGILGITMAVPIASILSMFIKDADVIEDPQTEVKSLSL